MIENKRILLVGNTAWSMYNFRLSVAKAMRDVGYKIIIIAPFDHTSDMIRAEGFEHLNIEMDNKGVSPVNDFKLFLNLLKYYRTLKPQMIFHYTIKPNIYGGFAAGMMGIPTISFVTGLGSMFIKRSVITRLIEFMYKSAFSFSRKVWFLNNDDCRFFVEKRIVPLKKTEVLPGEGINVDDFLPNESEISRNPHFKFLYLGRILKDKGINELIDASRIIKSRYPHVIVQILGFIDALNPSAITIDEVQSWVAEGVISYLGTTADVKPYIGVADCIVLPSYREGISRTLLEAASMQKPIIASDVTGCREVVDDGETGFLCSPMDVKDLVRKMEQMLLLDTASRNQMGLKARSKIKAEFGEEIIVKKYLKTLKLSH